MEKRLGFKSFLNVDYAPGMPDQVKKNAKKRKGDGDTTGVVEAVKWNDKGGWYIHHKSDPEKAQTNITGKVIYYSSKKDAERAILNMPATKARDLKVNLDLGAHG